jgi:hypothetical protein
LLVDKDRDLFCQDPEGVVHGLDFYPDLAAQELDVLQARLRRRAVGGRRGVAAVASVLMRARRGMVGERAAARGAIGRFIIDAGTSWLVIPGAGRRSEGDKSARARVRVRVLLVVVVRRSTHDAMAMARFGARGAVSRSVLVVTESARARAAGGALSHERPTRERRQRRRSVVEDGSTAKGGPVSLPCMHHKRVRCTM